MCDEEGCCPSTGHPLDEVMDSPVAAANVCAGDLGALLAVRPGREVERRVDRARAVLAGAARAAAPGERAAPLAILAWLAWYLGRGARTRLLLERALVDEPGHRLALMLA